MKQISSFMSLVLSYPGQGGHCRTKLLTGNISMGAVCYDHRTDAISFAQAKRVDEQFHGTGDLFASVLTGALCRGKNLGDAAQMAADFVRRVAAHTAAQDYPRREGVDFEPLLWQLGQSVFA